MKLRMPLTRGMVVLNQLKGREDSCFYLGEAEEQELEEGAEGTKIAIQTLHLIAFMIKYAPSTAPYKEGLYDLRALDSYVLVEAGLDRGEASNEANN